MLAWLALGVALANAFAGDAKAPGKDADGNALPDGALKRLGSLRWRHGEPITFLSLPSDGKTLITASQDSVLRLWDRETGKEIRRFVPPATPNVKGFAPVHVYMQGLTRAAMSRDGKLLAVALPGNVVQLWEVETGKALHQIKSPPNGVGALAFAPDGKTIAIRGVTDRICFLHETQTGKQLHKLKPMPPGGMGGNISGGPGDGTGLAFSPDGKTIALPELEFNNQKVVGSVTLFDVGSGKEIRRREAPSNGIASIAFSPDGKTLVFNTHAALLFQEADTAKEIRQIKAFFGANLIIYAPDGQSLAVKGRDQLVRLFDVNTGNLIHTIGGLPGQKVGNFNTNPYGIITTDVAYSPDSKTLVIGGQQMPRFFDVATGKEQPPPGGGHRGAVSAVTVAADGKSIFSRGAEGALRAWDVASGKETREIPEPPGTSAVCFSPDGKLVALANNDGTVRLLDVANGQEKRQFKAHPGNIATIAFSADGKRLATRGAYDGLLCVFDVATGTELKQITYQEIKAGVGGMLVMRAVHGKPDSYPLAFSPDGKTLVTFIAPQQMLVQGRPQLQADSNSLRFFDIATGKEVRNISMPPGNTIHQLAYSLDGRLLICENLDKTISSWEIASGQERSRMGDPAAAAPQSTATTWVGVNGIARSGPPIAPMGLTIASSRDGSLIAAPGPNNTIKVYDASLGKEVGSFRGHDGAIASLVFAGDGKVLVSGGNDSTLLVWDLARLKREPRPMFAEFQPKEFETLWADLLSSDAAKAGKTVHSLIARADASVALLQGRIHPAAPIEPTKIDQLLIDLDSSAFPKRALATKELEKIGELAIPALQKRLTSQPSLETLRRVQSLLDKLTGQDLTSEQIRVVRAIEVLDRVGTAEAAQMLRRLADGAANSLTTRQARMSLDRLLESKSQGTPPKQ